MRERLVAPIASGFWRVLIVAVGALLAVAGVALPSAPASAHTSGPTRRTQADTSTASARAVAVSRHAVVTANVVPNAPTGVTGVPGSAQVAVSWVAPVPNGGTAITRYTVTSSPSSRRCTSTSATTCTVTGLVNGTAYTFTVVARNTAGNSVASDPSSSVTPRTVPGAPTGVAATAGNANAEVRWSAPASNGGASIAGYTATSSSDGKTCTSAGATTCTVVGLTVGTAYTFRVVARNIAGSSVASSASGPVVPFAVPDPPTDVSAVAGNGSADVRWTAPASSGSSPISGYTATSSPDGKTCTSSAPSTSCTLTGLANGTAYTFRVTAQSAVGGSDPSAESDEVTPDVLPDAPTG
ncbi:MAG: fibronectin type III domain-containing protein, partial [Candidatus Nanopelagicales bacterium]